MSDITKTACRYAWTYPIIDIGRGELRNCCRTPFNTIQSEDWAMGTGIFKNLEAIKQLKRDLLLGVKNQKCRTCWTSEDYGVQSPRAGFEDFAAFLKAVKWHQMSFEDIKTKLKNLTPQEVEELVELEHPKHVELSLSTTCDLKCVYCSHVFSTQWATERLKYNEITIEQVPKNDNDAYEKIWWQWWEQVACHTVDKLTFVGGEPLINEKFYYYVDRLIEHFDNLEGSNHLHIFVATNLNTPKKYFDKLIATIEKITKSKKISIGIGLSFESVGERNEFIRSNADWKVFSENVAKLTQAIPTFTKNRYKANIVIMPSINSLSVSNLPEYAKYIVSVRKNYDRFLRLSNTHVTYPMRYSPFILTTDFVKYIDEAISILKASEYYNELDIHAAGSWISFTNYLETIKHSILHNNDPEIRFARKDFIRDIDKLSARRNLDFSNTFPELVEFYNYCKTL